MEQLMDNTGWANGTAGGHSASRGRPPELSSRRDTPDRSTETVTSIQASLEELQKATEELRKTNKELETNYSQLRRLVLLMLPVFFFVGLLPAMRWAASRQ
ncbi:hypothetical protein Esi_0036_0022 [Ectocarpus siliculosus]|uniref:Uncharacterized protein n=1 Tax=Ectocarpus siliculosus TaxID=2880 RepID=D8LL99_ECTSI|nr:hypothetical protein Esi_0036_0022 [Ectocarpus siliculosus]|eukprot:CBN77097.1 hypothetical protein Esi_0036_0022 [Ectocarpus siliculosus]